MKVLKSILVWLLLAASAWAQESQQQTQPPPPPPQSAQEQPEHHITKQEAEDLFRAVDEILAFDSERTGMPIKHPVKRKLTSRPEVQKFFLDSFKDSPPRQRAASFTIDQALQKMQESFNSGQ